jgi:hypothetical protein
VFIECETPIGRTGANTLPHHRRIWKNVLAVLNILPVWRDLLYERLGISTG